MNGLLAIIRKEWKLYFVSPIAYVFLGLFALLYGGFFFAPLLERYVAMSLGGGRFGMGGLDVNTELLTPLFYDLAITFVFLLPIVTMRLYAEELRSGTIELLKTAPVHRWEIVLGKFLGAYGLFLALVLITALCVGVVAWASHPDWRVIVVASTGVLLMGAVFLSLGLFISTLTRNQIVAAVSTFVLFLILWVIDWRTEFASGNTAQVLSYLSITSHFQNFTQGVLNAKDVVYYASLVAGGLFLTARRIELAE